MTEKSMQINIAIVTGDGCYSVEEKRNALTAIVDHFENQIKYLKRSIDSHVEYGIHVTNDDYE